MAVNVLNTVIGKKLIVFWKEVVRPQHAKRCS